MNKRMYPLALLIVVALAAASMAEVVEPTIDGKIEEAEYTYLYHSNPIGMFLYWSIVKDTLYVGLKAPAEGWVALNLMPMGGSIHGDTIIGYVVKSGLFSQRVELVDQVAPDDGHFPHFDDTERGGEDSILSKDGSQTGGVTIIEFSRKLNTGDANDTMISEGMSTMIMLAYHPNADDYQSYHGIVERIALTVDFFTGFVNDFPADVSHTGS